MCDFFTWQKLFHNCLLDNHNVVNVLLCVRLQRRLTTDVNICSNMLMEYLQQVEPPTFVVYISVFNFIDTFIVWLRLEVFLPYRNTKILNALFSFQCHNLRCNW